MSTKDTIAKVYEEFGKRELEVVLLFPTRTGLEKSIFDATRSIATYFLSTGLHDYANQKKGNENKKIVETRLISADESFETKTSLYRPLTKSGDFRFWPSRIPKIANAGDVLAILVRDGELLIINCSSMNFSNPESLSAVLPSSLRSNDVDRVNYGLANHALNKFLFDGRYCQKNIYLDFDGDLSAHLLTAIGGEAEDVPAKVFELVKTQLVLEGTNPFQEFVNQSKDWRRSKFFNYPPTTLFLTSLALVAETMSSADGASQNNYYDRLLEALQIFEPELVSKIKGNFKSTQKLWTDFNSWLNDHDGEIGIATAFPIIPTKPFISYPISQALLRQGDRENIQKFLTSRGFSSTIECDVDVFGEILGRWLSSTAATQYMRKLWSNRSLRKFIIQAAYSEIVNLPAQPLKDLGSGWRQANLKLKIVRRKFPKKRLEISIFSESKDGLSSSHDLTEQDASGVFEDGAQLYMTPVDHSTAHLGPNNSIRIERFLSNSVALLCNETKTKFVFISREAMAFEVKDREFKQVNRPKLYTEHLILLRKDQLENVKKFLNLCADKGYSVTDSMMGLPNGFCLIEKVRFVKPISVNDWDPADVNYWLLPSSFQTNLECLGGLRLRGNTYHVKSNMTLLFNSKSDVGTEEISTNFTHKSSDTDLEVDNDATSHSVEIRDGVGSIALSSIYHDISDGELELQSASGAFSSTNLSFRSSQSATNPPLLNELWASPDCLFALVSSIDNRKQDDVALEALTAGQHDAYNKYKFVGDYYEASTDIDVNFEDYSTSSLDSAEQSCVERGHHYWVVPPEASDGIWEGLCRQCGQNRLWPAKGKRQIDRVRKVYALMSRPFLDLDLNNHSYDLNTLFDAICYLQSVSWNNFRDLCSAADMPDFFEFEFIKSLSLMQHIDIELEAQSFAIKRCYVRPATLIKINDLWHLVGFSNRDIRSSIEKFLSCEAVVIENKRSVDVIAFENVPAEALDNKSEIQLDSGELIRVLNSDPKEYLSKVADLSCFYSSAYEISIGLNAQIQRFDPARLRWEEYSEVMSVGAYRTRWPTTIYFVVDESRRTLMTTSYLAKIYGAMNEKLRLHDYNTEAEEFICKIGCDLVPLAERALYACSGRLPRRKENGDLIYENVPSELAFQILNLHYGSPK